MTTITSNRIAALAPALTDQGLVERVLIDHLAAVLDLIEPLPAAQAIRLVSQLTAAIEKRRGRA